MTSQPELDTPNTPMETWFPYYHAGAEGIRAFSDSYKDIHGALATVICVLGIIVNILNVVVLTRKNMISSTNYILTGLAVSDGITMAVYLPYALWFYCLHGTQPTPERNTLPAIRYMLFFACISVVAHTVSIWLTVTLAIFRYIVVKYPIRCIIWCNLQRAQLAIGLVFLFTVIVFIPMFAIITINGHTEIIGGEKTNSTSSTIWIVVLKHESDIDRFIQNFIFWIQAILIKLVPCVGLTILSILLVHTMYQADKRRRNLCNKTNKRENLGQDPKTNRMTRMLLTVVILFLLTEFPHGILSLLSGILPHFMDDVYNPLGDILDILALINNGINFILYCTMSKKFRDTFINVFCSSLQGRT